MKKLSIAAAMAMAAIAAPSQAVTTTAVRITSAIPDYLQIAELQIFAGATNVALGGTATGSSVYQSFSSPDKAIDGDTNGDYHNGNGIFHSQGAGSGEYLLVTLAHSYDITGLTIFGRTDCCDSRDYFNYELLNGAETVARGSLNTENAGHFASTTFAAAGVPEPAEWAFIIGGLGLVGMASRRRRPSAIVTT